MGDSVDIKTPDAKANSVSVTMPDTSVFGAILRGDAQVAQELEQLRANGETIVVPWAVYNQILNTPNVVTKALQLTLIKELGLTVQEATTLKQRLVVYGGADPSDVRKNPNAPIGAANLKVGGVALDDLAIVADVWLYSESVQGKTKSVKLWTVERMASNPDIQRQYKITFSPLSRKLAVGKFVSAQDVLAMFPSLKGKFKVTADGRLVRTFWSGKIGSKIKAGAIVVGGVVVNNILRFFAAKIYEHYAQQALDEQFSKIRPQIERDIHLHKEEALKLVVAGRQAFAVTVIEIWTNSDFVTDQGTSMPVVEYHGLTISDTKKESKTSDRKFYIGNFNDTDTYTTSTPITFDKDFIDTYKDYLKQIDWYQQQIAATPYIAERQKLDQDLMLMIGDMRKILEQ